MTYLTLIALLLTIPACTIGTPSARRSNTLTSSQNLDRRLGAFFDQIDVNQHWVAGRHIEWESGDPDGKPVPPVGHHTHCSAFVAAACERLDIYILRPPDHGQTFLADAQSDWLGSKGGAAGGWQPVVDEFSAPCLSSTRIRLQSRGRPHAPNG